MRPPIILAEGLDIRVYETAAEAALAVEGPDAIAGTNDVYDADGFRLELRSAGGPTDYSARVTVVEPSVPSNSADELSARLRAYLGHCGQSASTEESLDALLGRVAALQGIRR